MGKDLNDKVENKKDEYYLPTIKGGNLLTDYEKIHLWEILPQEYKIKNSEFNKKKKKKTIVLFFN